MTAKSLRLAFAGQSLLARPIATTTPSALALRAVLTGSDAALTNLECAIAGRHGGSPTRRETLHVAPPTVLDSLAGFGFNLLALASNHAFDLGPAGILSALEEVGERGFAFAGTGRDAREARRPAIVAREQGRIGLLALNASPKPPGSGATEASLDAPARPGTNLLSVDLMATPPRVAEAQLQQLEQDVAALVASGAFAIVYVHQHYWIPDVGTTPSWLVEVAHRCVEAGAHVVVCHGPPVLHGIELYRRRPLLYGLGSFVFHTEKPAAYPGAEAWESVVALGEFDRQGNVIGLELIPLVHGHHPALGADAPPGGAPTIATGELSRALLSRLAERSFERHGTTIAVHGGGATVVV